MADTWVVGIDAGGTSTRLLARRAAGAQTALATGPSREDGGPNLESLLRAVAESGASAAKVGAVCAGITKVSRAGVQAGWEAALTRLFPAARITVVPDFVVAFHGATGGVGLGVLAGTGSVVYGEDGRGGVARVGGRGWEYGDEGSGAWLTTEMIRRTLRALDGMETMTPLNEAVCAHLGTQDAAALGEAARQRSATEGRGFLVPLAVARMRAGDDEARSLFVGAAGWLAVQAKAAAARLAFPEGEPISVATLGGLWEVGDRLIEPFRHVLLRWLPTAQVIAPRAAPVEGAAQRAELLLTGAR